MSIMKPENARYALRLRLRLRLRIEVDYQPLVDLLPLYS